MLTESLRSHYERREAELGQELAETLLLMEELARGSGRDYAGKMAAEQLKSGGKRIRARLALASAKALRVASRASIAWAAAVELLHNATLVHDDIQDGDTDRRGTPTLWVRHGVPQAINAGDLLLMLPFLALSQIPPQIQGKLALSLADYATRIVRGQAEEMTLLSTERFDWESYVAAARGKTGGLFALPIYGVAVLAGKPEAEAKALATVFEDLGVAFQIQDDLLDLFGDKGRGRLGCDICEGKVSALVAMQIRLAPETKTEIFEILSRPRQETTDADVERVRGLFLESGAVAATLSELCRMESNLLAAPVFVDEPALFAVFEELATRIMAPVSHLLPGKEEAAE